MATVDIYQLEETHNETFTYRIFYDEIHLYSFTAHKSSMGYFYTKPLYANREGSLHIHEFDLGPYTLLRSIDIPYPHFTLTDLIRKTQKVGDLYNVPQSELTSLFRPLKVRLWYKSD